jgi:hypothetical protein
MTVSSPLQYPTFYSLSDVLQVYYPALSSVLKGRPRPRLGREEAVIRI